VVLEGRRHRSRRWSGRFSIGGFHDVRPWRVASSSCTRCARGRYCSYPADSSPVTSSVTREWLWSDHARPPRRPRLFESGAADWRAVSPSACAGSRHRCRPRNLAQGADRCKRAVARRRGEALVGQRLSPEGCRASRARPRRRSGGDRTARISWRSPACDRRSHRRARRSAGGPRESIRRAGDLAGRGVVVVDPGEQSVPLTVPDVDQPGWPARSSAALWCSRSPARYASMAVTGQWKLVASSSSMPVPRAMR
jgi:hypothetical protein